MLLRTNSLILYYWEVDNNRMKKIKKHMIHLNSSKHDRICRQGSHDFSWTAYLSRNLWTSWFCHYSKQKGKTKEEKTNKFPHQRHGQVRGGYDTELLNPEKIQSDVQAVWIWGTDEPALSLINFLSSISA